jgi:hypothetical protein
MTTPIGTSSNVFSGTVQLGQVTNTYAGYLQSAGVAYNLILPWQADKLEWYNFTKFGTNSNNIQGVWFRDFPAADALIIARGITDLTSTLETTNGVTISNLAGGFTDQHRTVTGVTTATPGVVTTSAAHGLVDEDRVIFTKVAGAVGQQLNGNTYVVDVLSSTTFALYDIYGVPVQVTGTYTSGGQITRMGKNFNVIDNPVTYRLTLGTAIMGADNDVLYFVATKFNAFFNLGDVV